MPTKQSRSPGSRLAAHWYETPDPASQAVSQPSAAVYEVFKWFNSNCKIAERTDESNLPFLNSRGSKPAAGGLK